MISHIHIKDFAIIKTVDVELHPGLNAITGETGAGKSIIIEAVSMALGSRADTAMVRSGSDKALIQIVVDETNLPPEDRTGIELLTREISKTGKTVCRIDGEIVTLSRFAEETKRIADIHGQYDHQSLLDPENHVKLVDLFRASYILPAKARVSECWTAYRTALRNFEKLSAEESSSKRELDFLRFEVSEINAAAPEPGEYEDLSESIRIMQNGEKVHDCLSHAFGALSEDNPSALESIGHARAMLLDISGLSDEYAGIEARISECYFELEELSVEISRMLDRLEYSEQSLNDAIARFDLLDRLVTKYGGKNGGIEDVLQYRDSAQERLANIENFDAVKAQLSDALQKAAWELTQESLILSRFRRKSAEELEKSVDEQLRALNFSDAKFCVNFAKWYGDDSANNEERSVDPADFSENGIDRMEFLLSANKGQPLLPVAKAASGGELSRLMLAMKSATGDIDGIPTMIFDEIDAGISGVTASIVGEKLLEMADKRQIICITHLPQIAACAEYHFVIQKSSDDETTYTTILELDGEEKVREIARLLGGKNVTETTLTNARELINLSQR
ncbi:MAG: DNA repair protein RecN [Clostridiales Family XIII bacterium]|jgi:DNA repair protein RecN (Recombination protein N)|nr:DNA repair protein RecN [Clostridiales Family XIII bacterium]